MRVGMKGARSCAGVDVTAEVVLMVAVAVVD